MSGPARWLLVPILLAAAACGGDDADDAARQHGGTSGPVSELPAPEGAVGSVTGMPEHPGPGTIPLERTGTGPTAPASTATGTGMGTGTGTVRGTAQGDAVAASDDGGLDRMSVATDFPEPSSANQGTSSTAEPHVPPIIIISEPRETAPTTTDTTLPTEVERHDDH